MVWLHKFITKKLILRIGMIIFGIASALIAIITYYGQNAGNFVMEIDPNAYRRGIVLSADEEFLSPSPRLLSDAIINVRDMTYDWLKIDEAIATDGNYADPDYKYIAYTLYIQNIGDETCDVNMNATIVSLQKGLDGAIRFLVIEDETLEKMYMKPDTVETEYVDMPEAEHFVSDITIMNGEITNFKPYQIKKYTIIVWLEGQDPDCTDEILGGRIKLRLLFSITSAE
jgi:archaellum component FlaG (FlaF/FlaG flagellin family)